MSSNTKKIFFIEVSFALKCQAPRCKGLPMLDISDQGIVKLCSVFVLRSHFVFDWLIL